MLKNYLRSLLLIIAFSASSVYGYIDYPFRGCPEPIYEDAISVQIKGGVAPSHWTKRGPVYISDVLVDELFSLNSIPHFHEQFHTPWQAGAEVAWNVNRHVQLFLEGIYQQSDGKRHSYFSDSDLFQESFSRYKNSGGFLGGRYYFNRICHAVSFFLGFKAGIVYQNRVSYHFVIDDLDFFKHHKYYRYQWAPSAGLQAGADIALSYNFSLVLTGEVTVTQGMNSVRNIEYNPLVTGGITNIVLGETGKIVAFPVTLGLRYSF